MSEHELWNELGNLYFLSGAYPQAVRAYNRSIEMDEGFGRPYSNLALTYVQQGRFDEAVDLYRRSIELLAESKDKAITWNRLGNVYRHLKDYQEAVQAYRRADELDPEIGEGKEEPGWLSDPAANAPGIQHQAPVRSTAAEPMLAPAEAPTPVTSESSPAANSTSESMAGWSVSDPAPYQADISESLDPGSLTTWGDPNQPDDDPEANWAIDPDPEVYAPDVDGNDLTRWLPIPDEPQDLLDMVLDNSTAPAYLDEFEDEEVVLDPFPFTAPEPVDEAAKAVVFPFVVDLECEGLEVREDEALLQAPEVSAGAPAEIGAAAEAQSAELAMPQVAAGLPAENDDGAENDDADAELIKVCAELLLKKGVVSENDAAEAEARAFAAVLPADDIPAADVVPVVESLQAEDQAEATPVEAGPEGHEQPSVVNPAEIESVVGIAASLPAMSITPDACEHAEMNSRQAAELDVIVQEMRTADFAFPGNADAPAQANNVAEAALGSSTAVEAQAIPVTMTDTPIPERDQEEMHEIERGIAKFKRVVQVNPRNAHAWDALGNLYKSAGLYKEALLAYEQAISNDPSKALYHHHLGLVYACENRTEEAIDAFQRVIEIDPDHSLAHATLGGYYRKMGLEELAQKHVGKAMKSIFDSENEYNRACLAAICGNTDQALDLLRVALKNKQTYVDWILRDPDLDFIRQDPRFKQLISDYAR